jgi:addiction module RelE/StbE family toxin
VVIWTEPAKADLRAIHDFIAHDSRYYAKKVVQDIREEIEGLDEFPKIGRIVPELNDNNVRELPLYSYRIIYEISNQAILILAVVHQRRKLISDDILREAKD